MLLPAQVDVGPATAIWDWQTLIEMSSRPRSLPTGTAVAFTTSRSTISVVATNEPPTFTHFDCWVLAIGPELAITCPFTLKEIFGEEFETPEPGFKLITYAENS